MPVRERELELKSVKKSNTSCRLWKSTAAVASRPAVRYLKRTGGLEATAAAAADFRHTVY